MSEHLHHSIRHVLLGAEEDSYSGYYPVHLFVLVALG